MPMNTRDLWLVLRAQDQTNRALNSFTRNVRNAGDQVSSAHLQAQRAASLSAIANDRLTNEMRRVEIQQLALQKASIQQAMAYSRLGGASNAVLNSMQAQVRAIEIEIIKRRQGIAMTNAQIAAEKQNLLGINEQINGINALNRSYQDHEKALSHMGGRIQSVGQTATAMGFAMTVAGGAGVLAINELVQTAVAYEKQVRATATQVDGFNTDLQKLGDIGRRIARDIAVPFEQIQPALFDIFSSMEVGLEDAEKLLRQFSKAAVAGGVEIQDVSRATIGLLNAFQRPASDVNKILDAQFQLIQEGIGTYEEWNQRIGLVTPSAVRAGQSIEMMMAALAAATRMGISAARSGTSVARALDAISHPKTISNLSKLGVNVQDVTGKFRPFNEILRDFRAKLMSLPEKDRLSTMIEVFKGAGGTIEARRFLQNVLLGAGNLELFDTVLKEVENSAGSMEKAYGIMADGAAAKSQILKNSWTLLKEGLGTALTPAFITITELLTKMIDSFNQLDPTVKRNIALALAAATGFAAIIGPLLLLVGLVASMVAAFVVAGTAIVATLAVFLALIAILAVATAAFILIWKSSDNFRGAISDLGKSLLTLKTIFGDFLRDVKGSWDSQLAGPISNVADIINNKFLPAAREMQQQFINEIMPKLREAGRIIGDIVGQAFEWIGSTINNLVVPALKFLGEWWDRNKSQIEPLLPILAQVVKWLVIIAAVVVGVLVAAFVGPLVAAITATIVVLSLLVAGFIYAWKYIEFMWGKLIAFATWLGGVFVGVWQAIVSFFVAAWAQITAIFQAALNWIAAAWESYWNSRIGKLIIAVMQLIYAVIQLTLASIQFVIAWTLTGIAALWDAVWGRIANGVKVVWAAISTYVKMQLDIIMNGIRGALGIVGGIISAAWNVALFVTRSTWQGIVNAIQGAWNVAWGIISGIAGRVQGAFSGAGGWLYNAGKNIVQGLIDGITAMIGRVTDAINRVTGIIRDNLPGSPVKRGPLRVLNRGHAGRTIVEMIADGIISNRSLVADAMGAVGTGMIQTAVSGGTPFITSNNAYSRDGGEGQPKYITNNFNVTTNEIDPRRNSAELGWELQKVM